MGTYMGLKSNTEFITALGMVGCEYNQFQNWKIKYFELVKHLCVFCSSSRECFDGWGLRHGKADPCAVAGECI